jgi:hypothetical protein
MDGMEIRGRGKYHTAAEGEEKKTKIVIFNATQ